MHVLPSEPLVLDVFEDPAVVMPESLIPGPSFGGETILGWAPVMPRVTIPSVPDVVTVVPFPVSFWCCFRFAVLTNFVMSWVFLNEMKTCGLGGENVVVLSINLCLGLAISGFVRLFDLLDVFSAVFVFTFIFLFLDHSLIIKIGI